MKQIPSLLLLSLVLVIFSSCTAPEEKAASATASATATASPTENVEQVISKLEQEWSDAIIKRDLDSIDRIVAHDFSGTNWTGLPDTKALHVNSVKSGSFKVESQVYDNLKVRVFGDIAIATLGITEKSQTDGKDSSGYFLYTDVWAKRNGKWQIVAMHGCKGEPPQIKP